MRGRPLALPLLVATSLLRAGPVAAQAAVSYPTQASAITVDVVVRDGRGQPLRGLTRDDFTVLEDGRPQAIVGFEVRDLATAPAGEPAPAESTAGPATNAAAARPGRVLALLIDDLGISAPLANQLKPALAEWIRTRAEPRDEITLMTTSGSAWWSDMVATGREDLLTVLGRVQGRQLARGGGEDMSDVEAYRIAVAEQSTEFLVGNAARSRPLDGVPGPGGTFKLVGSTATERVTQRWLDSHVCQPCSDPNERADDCRELRQCFQRVQTLAGAIHAASSQHIATVLGAIARLSRGLAGATGRKSILLVSEEFLRDQSQGVAFRDAIDAAQRANTSLYFLDARGLAGASALAAESSSNPPRPQDLGAISVEQNVVASAGAESLADETGGTLTRSNDLTAGLERMASDASVYYLLGYQPEKTPDGKWHKLEVRVARPGARVLARRGYNALRPQDLPRAERDDKKEDGARVGKGGGGAEALLAGKRPLAAALLVGSSREGLPLRMALYVRDNNGAGLARVQVALEIDNTRVRVDRTTTPWKASLDLTILVAGLFHAPAVPVDEHLVLTLGPGDVGNGWWLVPRDVWLPPGVSQVRVLVKDAATGLAGLVSQRLEVPDVDQPYLSTPLITDRTLPPLHPGEPPRLVPTAHREFSAAGPLYCQYEVFGFGGRSLPGVAQLWGGYVLRHPDGQLVSEAPSSPIETDGRTAVRRIVLPAGKLEAGSYFLLVTIQDRLAGRILSAGTSFEIPETQAVPRLR